MKGWRRAIAHERELREAVTALTNQALALQRTETERRLIELNHAHERSVQDKAEFLKKEVYELTQSELVTWRREVEKTLTTTQARALEGQRWWGIATVLISLVITALGIYWRSR